MILRPAFRFVSVCLPLLFAAVRAHQGYESSILVRVLAPETVVIVRFTPPVATHVLGEGAPRVWTESTVADRQGWLAARAARLLALRDGDHALVPRSTRVVAEVDGHVAFVFSYPAATVLPLRVEAAYFAPLGPEFTGTMEIHGPPASPIERQGELLASLELGAADRVLTLSSLVPPPISTSPSPPAAP